MSKRIETNDATNVVQRQNELQSTATYRVLLSTSTSEQHY